MLAKQLGYCVQLRPCGGKDTQLDVCGDIRLGVGEAVVAHLLKCIPSQQDNGSIHHVVMGNFFTSPGFLCHLQKQSIAATGTVRLCRIGKPSSKEYQRSGRIAARYISCFYVLVNVLSTFAGKKPQNKVRRYSQKEKKKVDVLQPNVVNVYNRFVGGVDRIYQNISRYMVHLKSTCKTVVSLLC